MKKLLALLLALCMVFSLCACGSKPDASMAIGDPQASPNNMEVGDTDVKKTVDEPDGLNSPQNAEKPAGPNYPAGMKNPPSAETPRTTDNSPTEPAPAVSTPEPAASEPEAEPLATPSGLILMKTTDTNMRDPKIYSVDVETGKSTLIAEYNFAPKTLQDTIFYFPGGGFSCGGRERFASDYQKIAVSMSDSQTGQACAGWIDAADGSFFNVSEALGQLDRGDFDDAVVYLAVGFTDDGYFVYRQADGGRDDESSYHYVPVDNINPSEIRDGIPFPGYDTSIPFAGYTSSIFNKIIMSDYIGDSRYLINTSDGVSKIFDAATGEKLDYVPGTSRFSWHGVLSPDGDQVAFMSQPKNGTEKDIYIMPLEGGDPVKVPTDDFRLSSQNSCENGYDSAIGQVTMLMDWR